MKSAARLLFCLLFLALAVPTPSVADGGDPPPQCNPFTNPNCTPLVLYLGR